MRNGSPGIIICYEVDLLRTGRLSFRSKVGDLLPLKKAPVAVTSKEIVERVEDRRCVLIIFGEVLAQGSVYCARPMNKSSVQYQSRLVGIVERVMKI